MKEGARHLVLVGRTEASDAAREVLGELEQAGAEVFVARADISRANEVSEVLAKVGESMPPLRGIVHAAGVLDDGLLRDLDWGRFEKVLAPKAEGAWHLHSMTLDAPLDFFLLFSAAAALLGSPGQANYAAANAFLDALAHHRRALSLPALSINWGPWSEVGLAERAGQIERLARRGVGSVSPAQGVKALERLLGSSLTQVGVIPLDFRRWLRFDPSAGESSLLRRLAQSHAGAARVKVPSVKKELLKLERGPARRTFLEEHLRAQIGHVLRLDPRQIESDAPLGDLGIDSLMSLEIRNRLEASLETKLSATLVWAYPTLDALVEYLEANLEGPPAAADKSHEDEQAGAQPSTPEGEELAKLVEEINGLSTDEVLKMLSEGPVGKAD